MNWDDYFMNLAFGVSLNSKCLSRRIGAVIVKDGKHIISTGYNGPVAGSPHCDDVEYRENLFKIFEEEGGKLVVSYLQALNIVDVCPRRSMGFGGKSSEGIKYCQAAHAERNAIDEAARLGHSVEGCTMYMKCGVPCLECAKSIVNSGVKEIVTLDKTDVYEKSGITGLNILQSGNVIIRDTLENK